VGEVADPLKLPDWTVPLVVVLLGIGFPVAIVLAWAFEVTPEGVKKTPDTQSRSYLFAALAAVLLAAGGYYYYKDAGKDAGPVAEVEAALQAAVERATPTGQLIRHVVIAQIHAEMRENLAADLRFKQRLARHSEGG
jgi:hypothetical protein